MITCPSCGKPVAAAGKHCPSCRALSGLPGLNEQGGRSTFVENPQSGVVPPPPPSQTPPSQAMVEGRGERLIEPPLPPQQKIVTSPTSPGQPAAEPSPLRQTILEHAASVTPQDLFVPVSQVVPPLPYRPTKRCPNAQLLILDDGSSHQGECCWIRSDRYVIGRTQGDLRIPHDRDISAEHAEIVCRWQDGGYRWHLLDLQSTNGTFLRSSKSLLRHGKEFVLGSRRFVFHAPQATTSDAEAGQLGAGLNNTRRFHKYPATKSRDLAPRLIEMTAAGEGDATLLVADVTSVGSDPQQCNEVVTGDPFVSPLHARIYRHKKGNWIIEDTGSLNGVWIRIEHASLDSVSEFQLGEQRFLFRLATPEGQDRKLVKGVKPHC